MSDLQCVIIKVRLNHPAFRKHIILSIVVCENHVYFRNASQMHIIYYNVSCVNMFLYSKAEMDVGTLSCMCSTSSLQFLQWNNNQMNIIKF